jgi:hypothetical protein
MNRDQTVRPPANYTIAPPDSAAESDERLIADPRGTLTPGQMVDQKLQRLLGSSSRSLYPARTNAPTTPASCDKGF